MCKEMNTLLTDLEICKYTVPKPRKLIESVWRFRLSRLSWKDKVLKIDSC